MVLEGSGSISYDSGWTTDGDLEGGGMVGFTSGWVGDGGSFKIYFSYDFRRKGRL